MASPAMTPWVPIRQPAHSTPRLATRFLAFLRMPEVYLVSRLN